MKYVAVAEGVLACRWHNRSDPRGYIPPRGHTAVADLIDHHPVSGRYLGRSEWWIFLTERTPA